MPYILSLSYFRFTVGKISTGYGDVVEEHSFNSHCKRNDGKYCTYSIFDVDVFPWRSDGM